MMEFQAVIRFGKSRMKVNFTDGFVSSRGEHPAKYTTDNFMVQQAIEQSSEFKRGRIKRIKVEQLDEEIPVLHNPDPELEIPASEPAKDASGEGATEDTETTDPEDDKEDESEQEPEIPASEPMSTESTELTQVSVSGNDEARAYLETQFGVAKSKMRTRAEICAIALQKGIVFVFAK